MTVKKSNIYIFNPTCEMAVANGNASWRPSSMLRKFENDLATLPAFFAEPNDVVACGHPLSPKFLANYSGIDVSLPKCLSNIELLKEIRNSEMEIDKIIPWGDSQTINSEYKEILEQFPKAYAWNPKLKDFYSREFALEILNESLLILGDGNFLDDSKLPKVCFDTGQVVIEHLNNKQSVLKLPWSSSGRGVRIINRPDIHESILQRINGGIKQQGLVIIEPLLDKILDFALHFKVYGSQIEYLGHSIFDTTADAQYSGNYLNGFIPKDKKEAWEFLILRIPEIVKALLHALKKSDIRSDYYGYIGVDGLVYQEDGGLKIQPCLEINLRYNMGLLAFKLEKMVDNNSFAIFRQIGPEKNGVKKLVKEKEQLAPLQCKNGKILKGILPLTDFCCDQVFGAFLEVFQK